MSITLFDTVKTWLHRRKVKDTKRAFVFHSIDTPWGEDVVALYKGQPPYMPYPNGHGYLGVLLMRLEDEFIQCHVCGEFVEDLHLHLRWNHKPITALKYKEVTGIGRTAKIRSWSFLQKMREARLKYIAEHPEWVKKSRKHLKKGWEASRKRKGTKIGTNGSNTMRCRNQWGTCEAQLGTRLAQLAEKVGHTPKQEECSWRMTLIRRFGSWNKALEHYGYTPRTQ